MGMGKELIGKMEGLVGSILRGGQTVGIGVEDIKGVVERREAARKASMSGAGGFQRRTPSSATIKPKGAE